MKFVIGFNRIQYLVLVFLIISSFGKGFAQITQSGCTITFPSNFDAQVNISTIYDPAQCPSGDLVLDNLNDKNGVSTVTFDSDISLNSLTLNYKAGNNPLEVIIPAGVTVNIATDLTMNLSSAVQDKFLTVDGDLIVGGTIDFGGITLEIDGTGSIAANAIIGADNVGCAGSGTCPTTTANTCDSGTGDYCTTALPVDLVSFELKGTENGVIVQWITATEENNDYFELFRSKDGVAYNLVTTVDGAGNSTEVKRYEYLDKSPVIGNSYYKLRQTDFDGKSETFPAKHIHFSTIQEFAFTPNPVNKGEKLTIYTGANPKEEIRLSIINSAGIEVHTENFKGNSYSLDVSKEMESGIYVLKIESGKNVFVKRLLIK